MFSWAFCDFGPEFEVLDSTGEEPKEFFLWNITKVCRKYQNEGTIKKTVNVLSSFIGQNQK